MTMRKSTSVCGIFFRYSGYFLLYVVSILLSLAIIDGTLLEIAFPDALRGWTVLLFFTDSLLLIAIRIKAKHLTPAVFLGLFFLAVPVVGIVGYTVYEDVYGAMYERQLNFEFPALVWALGTNCFSAGMLTTYFFKPVKRPSAILQWNRKLSEFFLWVTLGVSFSFLVLSLATIGYVPLFRPGVDEIRASGVWEATAGEWSIKLSRLWLVAAPIATMFAFLNNRRKLYLCIVLFSGLALMVYGQREYSYIAVCSSILVILRFYKPRTLYLVAFIGIVSIIFVFYAQFRAGETNRGVSPIKIMVANLFSEWREYSYVVNSIHETGKYYREKIFIGSLVPLLPDQVWSIFGLDKRKLIHEYSAPYVFGRELGRELGIRVGTIGEAYAGYGLYWGVCLQMFLFGLIFGLLERLYIRLDKTDARLSLVTFLIALLMLLPITTLFVTTTNTVFFGFFFFVFILFATNRQRNRQHSKSDCQSS